MLDPNMVQEVLAAEQSQSDMARLAAALERLAAATEQFNSSVSYNLEAVWQAIDHQTTVLETLWNERGCV